MQWIPLTDAAAQLRLSYNQILRLVLIGELPGRRIGKRWVVAAEALDAEFMGATAPVGAVLRPVIEDLRKLETAVPETHANGDELESGDLITVEAACAILNCKRRWIYDRKEQLPFVKRIGPNSLRCSRAGIGRYLDQARHL